MISVCRTILWLHEVALVGRVCNYTAEARKIVDALLLGCYGERIS